MGKILGTHHIFILSITSLLKHIPGRERNKLHKRNFILTYTIFQISTVLYLYPLFTPKYHLSYQTPSISCTHNLHLTSPPKTNNSSLLQGKGWGRNNTREEGKAMQTEMKTLIGTQQTRFYGRKRRNSNRSQEYVSYNSLNISLVFT